MVCDESCGRHHLAPVCRGGAGRRLPRSQPQLGREVKLIRGQVAASPSTRGAGGQGSSPRLAAGEAGAGQEAGPGAGDWCEVKCGQ